MNTTKIFKRWKSECEKTGCYTPEQHIAMKEYADTPMWLRILCQVWADEVSICEKHPTCTEKFIHGDDSTECFECYNEDFI